MRETPVSGWGNGWGDRDEGEESQFGRANRPSGGVPDSFAPKSYQAAFRPEAYGSRPPKSGPRKGRTAKRILTALALLLALLLVVGGIGLFWAERQINPGGHRGPAVTVVIPKGASRSQIGHILSKAGVIHDATLFGWYVRLHGTGILYPGTYKLPKNSSYQSAISALENGPPLITDSLVIPEGFTLRQMATAVAALPGLHLSAQKFVAAATDGTVRSPYEPAGTNNLEGLLFPATYPVQQGETEIDVIQQMVEAFDQRAATINLSAAAARLGESPYALVTVASIVEKEAKLNSDRGPVASVIYNRLKAGMTLGDDSTELYYLRLTDPNRVPTATNMEEPGPYNTRINKGLPPTPIASPGLPSLQAAANPPKTDYLYFAVVKSDGQLGFATTLGGFAPIQQECLNIRACD
ncbi:MAG TPA: endolytic transglycosylase MltG [Acidimicrobiales bacterium]|nr:endolytic transglycosylase MltG [Acidimicrobiales bacterium]